MTLKQFREVTKDLPDHMDIFLDERVSDFRYGLTNSITVKEIDFMEEPDGEALSTGKAIVLSEY